jgi:hypothetical protein
MKQVTALVLLLALSLGFASAQSTTLYKASLGIYPEVTRNDFIPLRTLGFVHALPMNDNNFEVFVLLGTNENVAQSFLNRIQQTGFPNAKLISYSLMNASEKVTIQIAGFHFTNEPSWAVYDGIEQLIAYQEGDLLKIGAGIFDDAEAARKNLDKIKRMGFPDAYVRIVKEPAIIHLNSFETGIKKPLIPLNLNDQPIVFQMNAPTKEEPVYLAARSVYAPPTIDETLKSTSVSQLQKTLFEMGFFSGLPDGFYGEKTSEGYIKAIEENRELRKYVLLSRVTQPLAIENEPNGLQLALYRLPSSDDPKVTLDKFDHPLSKAYMAYESFSSKGPSNEVNNWMNQAISEAFKDKTNPWGFDHSATYAYNTFSQLVLHLYYLHIVSAPSYKVPCWLVNNHPKETHQAYQTLMEKGSSNLFFEDCSPFVKWDEVKLLQTIAADLSAIDQFEASRLNQDASFRSQLFLNLMIIPQKDREQYRVWDENLWKKLNGWAASDPTHKEAVAALKVAYLHSQIRLETHYIKMGMDQGNAKALAIATLQSLVGYPLSRFV